MALPGIGKSISFAQIEQEFGNNSTEADEKRTLGKYRISQTVGGMNNLPLDEDIPLRSTATGPGITPAPDNDTTIKFSQFRGKRLNVVVSYDTTNTGGNGRATFAKDKYNEEENITVIGGFKNRPVDTSGSKIIIHVHENVSLGSNKITREHCALRTGGGWNSGTVLEINIGKNAMVSGAGGNGGNGGRPFIRAGAGNSGENGSSAIGIAFPVSKITIQEGAIVRAGAGGGGGGGGAAGEGHPKSDERVGGAGGGGGVGIPAGSRGVAGSNSSDGGTAYDNVEAQPTNGGHGSQNIAGIGGTGGKNNEGNSDNNPTAQSGGGGGGGGAGLGGTSYTHLGNVDKITDFVIRSSSIFVDQEDGTLSPDGTGGSYEGEGGYFSGNFSGISTGYRAGSVEWESMTDDPILDSDVEMIGGSGSGFKVDIKYSPHQRIADEGSNNYQTKIEILDVRRSGSEYSEDDILSTERWNDAEGTTPRIIKVTDLESSGSSGTGGNGLIIDVGAGENSGKGGKGGDGDAEGSNREVGIGGSGGLGGYAIVAHNGASFPSVEGDTRIIGPTISFVDNRDI